MVVQKVFYCPCTENKPAFLHGKPANVYLKLLRSNWFLNCRYRALFLIRPYRSGPKKSRKFKRENRMDMRAEKSPTRNSQPSSPSSNQARYFMRMGMTKKSSTSVSGNSDA